MPDRIIRESALLSQTLDRLSDGAERLFWRLTVVADDHGRFDADPRVVLARAFPLRVGHMRVERVLGMLEELWRAGLIELYRVGERAYAHFPTWLKYQRSRTSRPKFPGPDEGIILMPSEGIAAIRGELPQVAANGGKLPLARARSRAESREPLTTESREAGDSPPTAASPPRWPSPEALVALYNAESPDECPAVQALSDKRREKARRFLAQFPDEAFWREVMAQCRASPFLRGKRPRDGHAKFVADFDWLLTVGKDGTENVVKVHDGKYQDG